MIVKIENNEGGFLMFDNIEEFTYNTMINEEGTKEKQIIEPVNSIDDIKNIQIFHGNRKKYLDIYFRQKSRSFKLKTDNHVYLLNDQGKTVDKLI